MPTRPTGNISIDQENNTKHLPVILQFLKPLRDSIKLRLHSLWFPAIWSYEACICTTNMIDSYFVV